MDSAFAWINDLIGWFGRLIPRIVIIRSTHEGVAFARGKNVVRLRAGVHWFWPFWTEILSYPVKRQSLDLPAQTLSTLDGETITCSAVMIYRINDIVIALAEQWDLADTVRDLGRTSLTDVVCDSNYSDIHQNRDEINKLLLQKCDSELSPFGVKVDVVKLTDFAKTRVITIFNGGDLSYITDEEEDDT